MVKRFFLLFLQIIVTVASVAQNNKITISGYIIDSRDGEKLIGAVVSDSLYNIHTISNNYGFYSIGLPLGYHYFKSTYVGYRSLVLNMNLTQDTVINFQLESNSYLDEVIVLGKNQKSILSISSPGIKNIPLNELKKLPVIMGERDVLKAIQMMPGIQSGSEANTGFYVRGGESDNNLILLDGVEVFNPNHLFGFFSFFNDDAIKSIKLYTSGFPSRYFGRVASIVDIRTKDGNKNNFKLKGSVGLISSKIQIEGPLIKDKLTFICSARRTYLDLFSKPIVRNFTDYSNAGYFFYDINSKVCLRLNKKNNFYISNYFGKDDGYFKSENTSGRYPPDTTDTYNSSERNKSVNWGSNLLTARYERVISGSLFMNVGIGMSNYNFNGNETNQDIAAFWISDSLNTNLNNSVFSTHSDIKMQLLVIDFDHYVNQNNHLSYGSSIQFYRLNPSIDSAFLSTGKNEAPFFSKNANLFIQDEARIGEKLTINTGLNLTTYFIDNESSYKLEKRFTFSYALNNRISINSSWSEMTQYLHLLRLGKIELASDLWLPSYKTIKPTESTDFSIGIGTLLTKGFSLSIDAFLRSYYNLITYKEGLVFNGKYNNFAEIVTSGDGKAKGIEFAIEKSSGSFTGLFSYCYSGSKRTFKELNQGKTFRSQYDRPHNLKLLLTKEFNPHWSVSCVFNLMSGALQTLPIGKYNTIYNLGTNPWYGMGGRGAGTEVIIYRTNSYRLPIYHRLDLSFNYTFNQTNFNHVLNFGLYNAYNAKNAYEMQSQIIRSPDGNASYIRLTKKVLFPIIPFISYNFEIK